MLREHSQHSTLEKKSEVGEREGYVGREEKGRIGREEKERREEEERREDREETGRHGQGGLLWSVTTETQVLGDTQAKSLVVN